MPSTSTKIYDVNRLSFLYTDDQGRVYEVTCYPSSITVDREDLSEVIGIGFPYGARYFTDTKTTLTADFNRETEPVFIVRMIDDGK